MKLYHQVEIIIKIILSLVNGVISEVSPLQDVSLIDGTKMASSH